MYVWPGRHTTDQDGSNEMYVVQLYGSPFDDRIALSVTADDGTEQTVYIAADRDETATVVWERPSASMRIDMHNGLYPKSKVLVDD